MKNGFMVGIVFMFCGCATLFDPGVQDMTFRANVEGAYVYVNGVEACEMPCSTTVENSKKPLLVTAKKEGYMNAEGEIGANGVSGFFLLNFVATSPLSTTIDVATGKMYKYSPNSYYFEMVKEGDLGSVLLVDPAAFVVQNLEYLRAEAAQGGGEYIDSLAEMIEMPSGELIELINNNTNDALLEEVERISEQ